MSAVGSSRPASQARGSIGLSSTGSAPCSWPQADQRGGGIARRVWQLPWIVVDTNPLAALLLPSASNHDLAAHRRRDQDQWLKQVPPALINRLSGWGHLIVTTASTQPSPNVRSRLRQFSIGSTGGRPWRNQPPPVWPQEDPEQVQASIALLDVLRVYDHSSALDPFQPMLSINDGICLVQRDPLPGWAAALL